MNGSQPILDLFATGWSPGPERLEAVAFDAGAVPASIPDETEAEPLPVWRFDLPGDPQAAARMLEQKEAELAEAAAALETVPERLERLAQWARSGPSEPVSFAAAAPAPTPAPDLPPEEAEVLSLLAPWTAVVPTQAPLSEPVSFSAAEGPVPGEPPQGGIDWAAARAQFESALEAIHQQAANLAWVETRLEGHLVGRTSVGWTGDAGTLWQAGVRQEQRLLHRRAVDNALRLRIGLLSALAIVTQGALKLSVLVATPGGAVLALPAAWRFANQIVAEARRLSKPLVS